MWFVSIYFNNKDKNVFLLLQLFYVQLLFWFENCKPRVSPIANIDYYVLDSLVGLVLNAFWCVVWWIEVGKWMVLSMRQCYLLPTMEKNQPTTISDGKKQIRQERKEKHFLVQLIINYSTETRASVQLWPYGTIWLTLTYILVLLYQFDKQKGGIIDSGVIDVQFWNTALIPKYALRLCHAFFKSAIFFNF